MSNVATIPPRVTFWMARYAGCSGIGCLRLSLLDDGYDSDPQTLRQPVPPSQNRRVPTPGPAEDRCLPCLHPTRVHRTGPAPVPRYELWLPRLDALPQLVENDEPEPATFRARRRLRPALRPSGISRKFRLPCRPQEIPEPLPSGWRGLSGPQARRVARGSEPSTLQTGTSAG